MADGKVALHGEGEDGEDGGVARHLGDQGPRLARHFTQGPWVLLPVDGLGPVDIIFAQINSRNTTLKLDVSYSLSFCVVFSFQQNANWELTQGK